MIIAPLPPASDESGESEVKTQTQAHANRRIPNVSPMAATRQAADDAGARMPLVTWSAPSDT
jgi:hypothetical protein